MYFDTKDVSRIVQLQAAKIRIGRKVRKVKDFSIQGGLDAQELPGEHRLYKGCELGRSATSEKNAIIRK